MQCISKIEKITSTKTLQLEFRGNKYISVAWKFFFFFVVKHDFLPQKFYPSNDLLFKIAT